MKPAWSVDAKTGKVYHYNQLVLFAIQGLICIIDERPGVLEGEHKIITPDDLEERVKALNIPYRGKTRADLPARLRELHDTRVRGSQNCMECIKEARAMGDPSKREVQAYWKRHKSRFTTKVSFSSAADPANYPELPPLELGSFTGRTLDGDANVNAVLADSGPLSGPKEIYKAPTKKNRSGIVLLDT